MRSLKALRQSLISKYTVSTSIVLLVTIALFAYFSISTLKNAFLQEAKDEVETLSEIILHTTHYQMLEDNRIRVYQMMEEVGSHEQIERIRLMSTDGMIHFSTQKNEIGQTIDQAKQQCMQCHCDDVVGLFPPMENSRRIFKDCNGHEILSVTTEIPNRPSCYTAACHVHPPEDKVVGILEVQGTLDKVVVQATAYRSNIVTFAISLLLVVIVCLTWLTQKTVIRPVYGLLQHARKVSKMDLDSRIESASEDELGELSRAFNEMTIKLKQTRNEYRELTETLEAKVKQRTKEIEAVSDQLIRSEKLASLGQLVAGIAHEINNPLAGILMFANMFANDQRLDQQRREDALIIVRETQRCANIVKRLLDFSRTSIPDKQLRSLQSVMNDTLSLVEHHAEVNNIEVVRCYGSDLPDIQIDPTQVEQVFINLLVNACQAMPDGGKLTITMQTDGEGNQIVTTIEDTGHGIPEENLGKIFDPFFTTKGQEVSGVAGTGLGLSVSYGIIQNHGGRISVESVVGKGTTFTVELPILAYHALEDEQTGTSDRMTA